MGRRVFRHHRFQPARNEPGDFDSTVYYREIEGVDEALNAIQKNAA